MPGVPAKTCTLRLARKFRKCFFKGWVFIVAFRRMDQARLRQYMIQMIPKFLAIDIDAIARTSPPPRTEAISSVSRSFSSSLRVISESFSIVCAEISVLGQ